MFSIFGPIASPCDMCASNPPSPVSPSLIFWLLFPAWCCQGHLGERWGREGNSGRCWQEDLWFWTSRGFAFLHWEGVLPAAFPLAAAGAQTKLLKESTTARNMSPPPKHRKPLVKVVARRNTPYGHKTHRASNSATGCLLQISATAGVFTCEAHVSESDCVRLANARTHVSLHTLVRHDAHKPKVTHQKH